MARVELLTYSYEAIAVILIRFTLDPYSKHLQGILIFNSNVLHFMALKGLHRCSEDPHAGYHIQSCPENT